MLFLASNSPRRSQLLSLTRREFLVSVAEIDESIQSGEFPWDYVQRLAEKKACAIIDLLEKPILEDWFIIGADTAVVVNNCSELKQETQEDSPKLDILGKPKDVIDAERMLRHLRGCFHQVFTGLVVLRPYNRTKVRDLCVTDVLMRDFTDQEIQSYIASGDPMDKAGAYAIQHEGFRPVERLEGCYANVMGLPLCNLTGILRFFDILPEFNISQTCQKYLGFTCQVYAQILSKNYVLS